MPNKYLHREDAPFNPRVWEKIDDIVIQAAKSRMSGRLLLDIEGPFGLELKAIPGPDTHVKEDNHVDIYASPTLPVARLQTTFTLSTRDISAFEANGYPLDFGAIAESAMSCADQEDALVFYGSSAMGTTGLMNSEGSQSLKLNDWSKNVGVAVDDVIAALTTLDNTGFHGPYMLALAPRLYNLLFRRYDHGAMTELEHLQQMLRRVVKAPALKRDGVLLAEGRQYASIIVGQDLMTGFIGPSADGYEFFLSESIALLMKEPHAFCVLTA